MWGHWAILALALVCTQAQMPMRPGRMGMPDPPASLMPNPPASHVRPRVPFRQSPMPSPRMGRPSFMSRMGAGFLLGNDQAKKLAANSYLNNNHCVAQRPYLKAILMEYMDMPPTSLLSAGMTPTQAFTFQQSSDTLKRINMMKELENPCLNNYPDLKMVLSDIVDINPLMTALQRGR